MRLAWLAKWWCRLGFAVLVQPLVVAGCCLLDPAPVGAATETATFVAVPPARLFDSRDLSGPMTTARVHAAGVASVPADASAIALNVTATDASGAGFVVAWPAGGLRPLASNLNVERTGQTIANMVVVAIGEAGSIDLFASAPTHLVVDVLGAWVPASSARAGRLIADDPRRLIDTRDRGSGLGDGGRLDVDVGPGTSAAVLNVTATETTGPGFITVWSGDGPRPVASNLNVERPGQTIPNLVIAPVSSGGRVSVFAQTATHLVIDLLGTFTTDAAPDSDDGLFRPIAPHRLVDTREHTNTRLTGGYRSDITVGDGQAVFVNLTATEASLPGYLTAWPAATPWPGTSNLNVTRSWQTIPNLALVRLGAGGRMSVQAQHTTQLVADVAGTFTGSPLAANHTVAFEAPTVPWPPSSAGTLRLTKVVADATSPKSVVASGSGLFFAQNMMYSHTITVHDRSGGLVRTISDRVGAVSGAPVEAAMHPNGRHIFVSNYSQYGPGVGPEGFDDCSPGSPIGDSTVYRVDLATLAIDQVIPVGRVPKYLAVSPDGRWLAVTNWCSWDVSIVDTASGQRVATSPVLGRYPPRHCDRPNIDHRVRGVDGTGRNRCC